MFIINPYSYKDGYTLVTANMTLDATWDDIDTDYDDLINETIVSCYTKTTINSLSDDGVIMESGARGRGLGLYLYNGTLYFQCGDGGGYTSASDRAVITYELPSTGVYEIEWSADCFSQKNAALYVNGQLIGTDSVNYNYLCGIDWGGIGGAHNDEDTWTGSAGWNICNNPAGWVQRGDGAFSSNVVDVCRLYIGEITDDV